MTDEEKRKAIREFFAAPCPFLHWRTIFVGGSVAFLGVLSAATGDGMAGIVLAAVGALYGLALPVRTRALPGERANEAQLVSVFAYPAAKERYRSRPSPEQVTAWLLDDLARIERASEDRLGLDETTRDPLCVVGPLYFEVVEGIEPEMVLRRRTSNGYLYSSYQVSVFQFSETHLGVYECHYDMAQDRVAAVRTAELFYKDVVAVRMATEASGQVLKSGERLQQATTFSLTVASGDRIRVVIDDPAIRVDEKIRSLGNAAVANIRAMLRQNKAPLQES